MANPGVGNKFVSVNLNRSYGKSSSLGGGRARPSGHGVGGMVVLSKARSVVSSGQKGSRLSVPAPLNLPSLRKEHEKIDPSSGTLIGASSGPGLGSGSSSIGWTKPHSSRIGEGEANIVSMAPGVGSGSGGEDASARVSVYTPPGARGTVVEALVPGVEKVVLLRGEDFPSLQASLPVAQSPLRMKEQQRRKQRQSDVESREKGSKLYDGMLDSPFPLPMRPQLKPRGNAGTADENNGLVVSIEKTRIEEGVLSDPLHMVRLDHSDWADDERDTSYRPERNRVRFPSRNEREIELNAPRSSMPRSGNGGVFDTHSFQKNNSLNTLNSDRDGRHSSFLDAGSFALRDVYGRELPGNRSGRDENSWRGLHPRKDGYVARDVGLKQNGGGDNRPASLNKANAIYSKLERVTYSRNLSAKDDAWDGPGVSVSRPQDSYGQIGQKGNNSMEMVGGRSSEQSVVSRQGNPSSQTRCSTGDMVRNSVTSRSSFSLGAKFLPVNDPTLSFGKDKRSTFSRNGKPYIEDGSVKDLTCSTFDGRDPFAPDVRQFKKKKDLLKNAEFYDPVRESFEAELERVQKMQEQERQRILEEQARALELARKEEEERERLAREEAERRRRLEEEAREAARRADQERSEVARRAEEQKRAREEEKRQVFLEEERRKEAARQKLLELEARIARRQAEVSKDEKLMRPAEDSMHGSLKDKEHSRTVAGSQWEESERSVDRFTGSASSESSNLNRSYDAGSRHHFSRDGNAVGFNRTKNVGSWKGDGHDVGSSSASFMQDSDCDDVVPEGKGFSRREFHGGPGYMSNRGFSKVGAPDILMNDDVSQIKMQRWNFSADDGYSRRLDIDGENSLDRIGDLGWRQDQVRGGSHALDAERLFQSSEIDGVSSGRSRHFVRQPRVLPPPSLTSVNRSSSRVNVEQSSSSTFVDGESGHQHPLHKAAEFPGSDYGISYHQSGEQSDLANVRRDSQRQDKNEGELGCDSQSSLSVSSMPNSPTHLSHDDVEDSTDSNAHRADYEHIVMSDNDSVMPLETENKVIATLVTSVSPEEEDWTVEGNGGSREQEEYDEEEDAYQEDDEVHEGDEENFDLAKDFRGLHVEQQVQTPVLQADLDLDNVVKAGPTEDNDFVETGVRLQQVAHVLASERRPPEASLVGVVQNSDENDQPRNNLSELHVPVSADETGKALQDLVPQPMNASSAQVSSTRHVDDNIESSESVLSVQQMHASAVVAASSSPRVQPVLGGVPSVTRQTEVNVPMQFGLFSGPTLMPSPLPAIQIGSIRMPLHLHPQVGQPLTQLHPSQPSMFQFGHFSYPSPLTQGILPIPQTLSFVQPTVPSHYSLNQQPAVSLHSQAGQEPPHNSHSTEKATTDNLEYKQPVVPKLGVLSQENLTNETSLSVLHDVGSLGDKIPSDNSFFRANGFRSELLSHAGDQSHKDAITKKIHGRMINNRDSQDRVAGEPFSSNACSSKRVSSRVRDAVSVSGARGGKVVYSVRSAGPEHPLLVTEASHVGTNNFRRKDHRVVHRTEFRVREKFDKKQADGSHSQGYSGQGISDPNVRVDGMTSKGGGRKDFGVHKDTRQTLRPESGSSGHTGYHAIRSEGKTEKTLGSEAPTNRQTTSEKDHRSPDRNLNRNIVPEEDVDASLQSGVVRVFDQLGIEAPSDEDDFIEVRSKRQMLNDRREQREKEIKAKSRAAKGSRKPRALPKTDVKSSNFNKIPVSLAADGGLLASNAIRAELSIPDGRLPNKKNVEVPSPFTSTVTSQSLPPIGTPAANTDVQTDNRHLSVKAVQASSFTAVLGRGGKLVPGLSFDNNTGVIDNVSSSLGSWGSACANLVMPLTQTQLDEAMKPAHFDAQVSPPVDCSSLAKDTSQATASQDKSFSASLNSLNSLLAGEKIQFGAVTSHTILPPDNCAASKAVGPVVSCMSNMPIEHKLPGAEGDCLTFFNKAKHSEGSQLEDPEAEAEAAASAIAVAAISNDEPIGNGLASDSVSVIGVKSYGGVDVSTLPAEAVASTVPLSSQSRSEESLSVSLPADLSVETTAPSLWPPLPSSQSSSSPMLSHFQGVPHSHFPCFEMSPMLGSQIFTFGSHEESADGQLQAQRNIISGSGSLGAWQHHSGIDSFYGPPAGLTGPFVGPPGAIPGIQGSPHMVVYNHFGPVGQFGQMGLRLMGTTYVPSGNQPDWKHIPVSSTAAGMHDGNINNLNLVPGQCEPSIPVPIQHLAPGSPLMPIAPPLGLFDMSPFQPSPDLAAQARWSHVPAPSLHSLPLSASTSVPLQQAEVRPQQFSGTSMESSGIRFGEGLPLKPADGGKTFTTNDAASQFPDDLGLGDASSGNGSLPVLTSGPRPYNVANIKVQNGNKISLTAASEDDGGDIGGNSDSISANTHGNQSSGSTFALQAPQPQNSSPAYLNQVGYTEQKDRVATQRTGSASEWPRRHGLSGKNHTGAGDKNFSTSKMKQIYVAKPTSSSSTAN